MRRRDLRTRAGDASAGSRGSARARGRRESGSETSLRRGRATTNFLVENLSAATLSCGEGRTRAPREDAAPTSKTRRRPRRLRRREEHPHRGRAHAPRVFPRKNVSGQGKDAPKHVRRTTLTASAGGPRPKRELSKRAPSPSPLSLAPARSLLASTLALEGDGRRERFFLSRY